MQDKPRPLRIAQYHPVWLPLTMTWLHRITQSMSGLTNQLILCENTTGEFSNIPENIEAFQNLSLPDRTYQKLARKIGFHPTFPFYTNTLRVHKSQLLHAHFGHIGVEGSKIADSAGIPCIVSFYGMDIRQIPQSNPRWLERYQKMFSKVHSVLCEGPYMARDIEKLGCPPEKIIVYPLGIDLNEIPFLSRNWAAGEKLKILMAASFREKKGLSIALKALAALKDETDFDITIVGDAGDDHASQREKKRMFHEIEQGKLADRVTFKGFLPHYEVMKLAYNHHIFLSPSKHASDGDCEGGAPVTIIEMAATGITVVSTTHCDIPEVILDKKTGWLANEGSFEDLTVTLREACDSYNLWPGMAAASRKHVEQKFNFDVQIQALHDIYRRIIHG
jgi:colanic acid/amylovoran biosynthesis glycosyltransferase